MNTTQKNKSSNSFSILVCCPFFNCLFI